MSEPRDQSEPVIDELDSGPGSPPSTPATIYQSGAPRSTPLGQRAVVRSIHYSLSYILRHGERGTDGALVLLHDLPGGAFEWADVLPALDATNRAIYVFDMLGYGESAHPWPSDTSVWGQADCLNYALEALNLRNIVLVGIGLGGAVAQVLATRLFRANVASLVLINSYAYEYAFAPNWPLTDMEKRQDPDAPKHTKTSDVLNDLRATLAQGSAQPKTVTQRLEAYVSEWDSELGKELLFQHVRLMKPLYLNSVGSDLRRLNIPVLVLWGEADRVTPPALGERLAREIPGAKLVTLPGTGHMALVDAPNLVAKEIVSFAS